MPELYKLTGVILVVSCIQVSVELLFSLLNYILSYRRYNLRDNRYITNSKKFGMK